MSSDELSEAKEVLRRHYSHRLKGDISLKEIQGGLVNASFVVDCGNGSQFFFRRYCRLRRASEIEFEHNLMRKLSNLSAKIETIMKAVDGASYVRHDNSYYTLFEFLDGVTVFDWDQPVENSVVLRNSAALLAEFHLTVENWTPKNTLVKPRCTDVLIDAPRLLAEMRAKRVGDGIASKERTVIDNWIETELDSFISDIGLVSHEITRLLPEKKGEVTPQGSKRILFPLQPIHGDFHQGNLFFRDKSCKEILSLFDFDWCNYDLRCYDIGLSIFYFCSNWVEHVIDLEKVRVFLSSYLETHKNLPNKMREGLKDPHSRFQISSEEVVILPIMIAVGSIQTLIWALMEYCNMRVPQHSIMGYHETVIHCRRILHYVLSHPDLMKGLLDISKL